MESCRIHVFVKEGFCEEKKARMLLVMASIIFVFLCVGNAMASNMVADEVTDETMYQIVETETEKNTLEDIIAAADEVVRKLDTVTDGQSSIAHETISEITQQMLKEYTSTARIDYEVLISTLELTSALSSADGLSFTQTASMLTNGITAYMDANGNDSYRHFTWNFSSSISIGSNYARIYTINYEWANVLLSTYKNYYTERCNYYYDFYYWALIFGNIDSTTIINMATADADDYIVALRDTMKTTCKASKNNFSAVFNSDNIMDFWNNYYGRSYASSYSTLTAANAYNRAVSNNVLILSPNNVTSSQITTVYNSNWWYTGN